MRLLRDYKLVVARRENKIKERAGRPRRTMAAALSRPRRTMAAALVKIAMAAMLVEKSLATSVKMDFMALGAVRTDPLRA